MKIIPDSNYEKIYTGSSIKATYLKALLEDEGIPPILRDDGESARAGGFAMDYANGVKVLVHKKDVLKAKYIVQNALDENGDIIAISEDELEKKALASNPEPKPKSLKPTSQNQSLKRSPFNLLINVLLIIFSIFRLSPLLKGETLPTYRIILSSGIILFCSWALIKHFRK